MENNICHFEIPVDDPAAARAFYGGLFSWQLAPAPALGEDYLFVRTSQEPGAVAGGLLRRTETQPGVTIYFTVSDLEESTRKLQELGGSVLIPRTALPRLGWTAVARDPQGNCFGLFQQDPEAV